MNRAFTVYVFSVIVFLCIFHTTVIHAQVLAQTKGFLTYNNPTFNIKIQYPFNWKVDENKNYSEDNIDVVTFSSPVDQQVSISVDTIEDNSMTLMQYVNNVVLDDLKQSRDFTMLKSDPNAVLDGNRAYSVTYTDKDPDFFKGMEIVTVKDGKVYDISYTADLDRYDSVLSTVQTMIKSFMAHPQIVN
jgi:eukaryotic-like serine/threonine-protein kinase